MTKCWLIPKICWPCCPKLKKSEIYQHFTFLLSRTDFFSFCPKLVGPKFNSMKFLVINVFWSLIIRQTLCHTLSLFRSNPFPLSVRHTMKCPLLFCKMMFFDFLSFEVANYIYREKYPTIEAFLSLVCCAKDV